MERNGSADARSPPQGGSRSVCGRNVARPPTLHTSMTTALAVGAALVALVLTMALTERWLERRRRHEATWALALALFVLGAASLAWGSSNGWSTASFRAFYLFGAIVNVPFLAVGQLEFMLRQDWVRRLRPATALVAAFSAGVMATATFSRAVPTDRLAKGSDVLGVLPRVLAATCSGLGAVIVFAGTVMATLRLRKGGRRRAAVGTACIALGTAVLSSSGLLNAALGEMRAFSVTLTLGMVILFIGFVMASSESATTTPNQDFTSAHAESLSR